MKESRVGKGLPFLALPTGPQGPYSPTTGITKFGGVFTWGRIFVALKRPKLSKNQVKKRVL